MLICNDPRIELPVSLHVPGLRQKGLATVHHLVQETDSSVLFTRKKAVITIDANIEINMSPTNGLFAWTQGTTTADNLEVGSYGLYSSCCHYYLSFIRDTSEFHERDTRERTQCKDAHSRAEGMTVEYAFLSNALSVLQEPKLLLSI